MPCQDCGGTGRFVLDQCPRAFVGPEITEAVNMHSLCEGGFLPVAGGILDQSSWFLTAKQFLVSEENRIENDRIERRNRER